MFLANSSRFGIRSEVSTCLYGVVEYIGLTKPVGCIFIF